jgi:8-oxo-dGTP pyrophosphatase MutT (NUDIX family)
MKKTAYRPGHSKILQKALLRLKELEPGETLPLPYKKGTGVLGKSTVYFIYIPRGNGGHNIVAKFDDHERQQKEWHHIKELRRLDIPPSALLPIDSNAPKDGVIIYRAVQGFGSQSHWLELKDFIKQQWMTAPSNCIDAIHLTFNSLAPFYESEPGQAHIASRNHVLRWEDLFPVLSNHKTKNTIQAVVAKLWPKVKWTSDLTFAPTLGGKSLRQIPNPVLALDQRLNQFTNRVMLSRIHGDLNLSNIIIGQSQLRTPESAYIIDLSHCESDKVTALDFARVEIALFLEIFAEADLSQQGLINLVLRLRDYTDGRAVLLDQDLNAFMPLVAKIRNRAIATLSPVGRERVAYSMEDFFYCLYLHGLRALAYPSVNKAPRKAHVALLVSSLSLQVLSDLERGRYSSGASQRLHFPRQAPASFSKQALKISIGIVTRKNQVLLVKRRIPEDGLAWQFPAGIVKPVEAPEAAICDEIKTETGITVRVETHIGQRLHPNTQVECDYYHCVYLHGNIKNADPDENSEVRWVPIEKAAQYFTSDIFPPILQLFRDVMSRS